MSAPHSARRPDPLVSLVIPVYDEEAVLPLLLERIRRLADRLPGGLEAVFVDDGSRDGSARLLAAAHAADPRLKLVELSRNFGQAAAITAGLDHAQGDAIVLMDADLRSVTPEWVDRLVAPILADKAEIVTPIYTRDRHEVTINDSGDTTCFFSP